MVMGERLPWHPVCGQYLCSRPSLFSKAWDRDCLDIFDTAAHDSQLQIAVFQSKTCFLNVFFQIQNWVNGSWLDAWKARYYKEGKIWRHKIDFFLVNKDFNTSTDLSFPIANGWLKIFSRGKFWHLGQGEKGRPLGIAICMHDTIWHKNLRSPYYLQNLPARISAAFTSIPSNEKMIQS